MAKTYLLGFLAWILPVQLAGTCLRCWPDAAIYFGYDAYLLLEKDAEATDKLGKLFLGHVYSGTKFLERDHMEREAGHLFLRLENLIQHSGKDHDRFLREAEQEKKNFVKKLEEASQAFMKESCSYSCGKSRYRPYEVANCANCRLLKSPCNDPVVCAGSGVIIGVVVTLLILLGMGGAWGYYHYNKKVDEEDDDEDKDEEDKDKESSSSSEGSESAEESEEGVSSPPPSLPPRNIPRPPSWNIPSPPPFDIPSPPHRNIPSPPHRNIPSPPHRNIPSPPPFDIPSPPPFDIPSPPPFNYKY